jgi:hypothetical protein
MNWKFKTQIPPDLSRPPIWIEGEQDICSVTEELRKVAKDFERRTGAPRLSRFNPFASPRKNWEELTREEDGISAGHGRDEK